jgi:osmotically-inducible protein OsmY
MGFLVVAHLLCSPVTVVSDLDIANCISASLDEGGITVETHGGEVVFKGTARSGIERKEAERAAWAAPGVVKMEDRNTIGP